VPRAHEHITEFTLFGGFTESIVSRKPLQLGTEIRPGCDTFSLDVKEGRHCCY